MSAGPAPGNLSALLQRWRPWVQYDSQETFYADSVRVITDSARADGARPHCNTLCRADGTVLASADLGIVHAPAQLTVEFLAPHTYPGGQPVRADDYIDEVGKDYITDGRRMHAVPGYADQIHGHVVTDNNGRVWLQYWFFYYYNDKGFLGIGLHEGDWEMIQIGLSATLDPEIVTLSQHAGGERCRWQDLELRDEDADSPAPVIYPSRGSHACRPAAGAYPGPVVDDNNDARGPLVRPRVEELTDQAPSWASWPGRWGSTRARAFFEAASPPGPIGHGQWRDPARFHQQADPFEQVEQAATIHQATPGPPTPTVEVRREGAQAMIDYTIPPPRADQPAAEKLLLSIENVDDPLPPATYGYEITEPRGTIAHPLTLTPGRHEIRASTASSTGRASPTTTVELGA